jgi:hypothetical protein
MEGEDGPATIIGAGNGLLGRIEVTINDTTTEEQP